MYQKVKEKFLNIAGAGFIFQKKIVLAPIGIASANSILKKEQSQHPLTCFIKLSPVRTLPIKDDSPSIHRRSQCSVPLQKKNSPIANADSIHCN